MRPEELEIWLETHPYDPNRSLIGHEDGRAVRLAKKEEWNPEPGRRLAYALEALDETGALVKTILI